jgi:hypothetical protein
MNMERMRQYPRASQPEIMRAAEKDEHYASHLCEACHDAFRHAFGNFLSMLFASIYVIFLDYRVFVGGKKEFIFERMNG